MPQAPRQEDLLVLLDKMERRLRALEGASRMRSAGQPGGTFQLTESDGTGVWLSWGEYTRRDGGAAFGFMVNAIDGDEPLSRNIEVNSTGLALPSMHASMVLEHAGNPNYAVVTSGSFEGTHRVTFHVAFANALRLSIPWSADAGTTGELKVKNLTLGGGDTNTVALSGAGGFVEVAWLHGQPIQTGPFQPEIQVRRTGGAGNIYIFNPYSCYMTADYMTGATAGGI